MSNGAHTDNTQTHTTESMKNQNTAKAKEAEQRQMNCPIEHAPEETDIIDDEGRIIPPDRYLQALCEVIKRDSSEQHQATDCLDISEDLREVLYEIQRQLLDITEAVELHAGLFPEGTVPGSLMDCMRFFRSRREVMLAEAAAACE